VYYHQAAKTVMSIESYRMEAGRFAVGITRENHRRNQKCKAGVYKVFSENGMVLEESIYKNNEYNGLAILKIRKVM
jgi:antitoxin component YwqK of YwqJK toxin-antitoxin module